MGSKLDLRVIGNCVVWKAQQDPSLKHNHRSAFEVD